MKSGWIDRESVCESYLKGEIAKLTVFKTVSQNPGELLTGLNYPLVVILNDGINLDPDHPSAMMSIVIKNKGEDIQANLELTRMILDLMDKDPALGENCILARAIRTENDMDMASGSQLAVKSVFTRIEVEVLL